MNPPVKPEPGVATDSELVELSIPARPELLSIPRMAAAAVAAQGGFDIEQVEDIRLAIEELCLATFEGRGSGRLHLRFGIRANAFEVECTFAPDDDRASGAQARGELAVSLTEQLLSALADEHGADEAASGGPRAWFRKGNFNPPA